MPPARSKARKRALDILFEAEQRGTGVLDLLAERITLGSPPVPGYAADLVRGVAVHTARIDELISQYAEGWTLDRMPAVDRNVLRIGVYELLWARLAAPMPEDRPWGWLGPLLVTAFGAFLRFDRLRVPKALIFDETYYAKDAWSILKHGVELKLLKPEIANPMIVAGHTNFFAPCDHTSACGEYVVQPEVGKLLIAVGEWLFGLNPFGWRFASAVFGSLAILLICRIARRMTRSTLLGCVAGLLMS